MHFKKDFTFHCRLTKAEEEQQSAYQEKQSLQMKFQDEIDHAKVKWKRFDRNHTRLEPYICFHRYN